MNKLIDPEFEKYISQLDVQTVKEIIYSAWQTVKAKQEKTTSLELEGGWWWIDRAGKARNSTSTKSTRLSVRERKTKEAAERAAKLMLKRDVLQAWVDQHCGGYEIKEGGKNCFIFSGNGEYTYGIADRGSVLGAVYMPEETAIWLCEKLNNGEIVL